MLRNNFRITEKLFYYGSVINFRIYVWVSRYFMTSENTFMYALWQHSWLRHCAASRTIARGST
jgi:hypothetical protein